MSWELKYIPKSLDEVIGHKLIINEIKEFLHTYQNKREEQGIEQKFFDRTKKAKAKKGGKKGKKDKNEKIKSSLIINGSNGVGKTLTIDLIIKELVYHKVPADLSSIEMKREKKKAGKISKNIQNFYINMISQKDFYNQNKKKILVIDNITPIISKKDQEIITGLVKMNMTYHMIPIILICNDCHIEFINTLKKSIKSVKFEKPSDNELKILMNKIIAGEQIKMSNAPYDKRNVYRVLSDASQYDYRRMIGLLKELHEIYKMPLSVKLINDHLRESGMKDEKYGLYESTNKILNNYQSISQVLQLYGEERSTIPLMINRNYPEHVNKQYHGLSPLEQIKLFHPISKLVSESDRVEGYIHSQQTWILQKEHGLLSCLLTTYHLNKEPNKKKVAESYEYPKDYTNNSNMNINNKITKKVDSELISRMKSTDFINIVAVFKHLHQQKEYEKLAELMKEYQITSDVVKSLSSIDKIRKSPIVFNDKENKMLSAF